MSNWAWFWRLWPHKHDSSWVYRYSDYAVNIEYHSCSKCGTEMYHSTEFPLLKELDERVKNEIF